MNVQYVNLVEHQILVTPNQIMTAVDFQADADLNQAIVTGALRR